MREREWEREIDRERARKTFWLINLKLQLEAQQAKNNNRQEPQGQMLLPSLSQSLSLQLLTSSR